MSGSGLGMDGGLGFGRGMGMDGNGLDIGGEIGKVVHKFKYYNNCFKFKKIN